MTHARDTSGDWFFPPALAAPDPTAGVGDPDIPAPAVAHPDEPPAWPGPDDELTPFGTAVAELYYPELAVLAGWTWWWAGGYLVGYHATDLGITMLYIDGADHAAITRTTARGEFYLHRSGELATILQVVPR